MSKIIVDKLSHAQKVRILYKTILRLHRGLPVELRDLGNQYAREEFRRHLSCSPMEAHLFMTEWAKYAVTITSQLGLKGKPRGTIGDELDTNTVEMLKDDQVVQLYGLMLAAKGLEDFN
ncbi:succinate dehydrogenase assembly factor 3, mitochondrial isoform X2 [Eurosta solidaginis]|uniref:succinate dehydrogenase assembly factor 3, mitochondrial isoform X2 n=1 Tax=Eurosta solidaginis TaxID=178769 RepID=UPI0035313BE6